MIPSYPHVPHDLDIVVEINVIPSNGIKKDETMDTKLTGSRMNVDEILRELTNPIGVWQWSVAMLLVCSTPSLAMFAVYANSSSPQRCRMETRVELAAMALNLTFQKFASYIGPWPNISEGGNQTELQSLRSIHGCLRYKLNWATINTTLLFFINRMNTSTTDVEPCPMGYVFAPSDDIHYSGNTVEEFQTICDQSWLVPLGTSLFMFGMLIGFILGGLSGDQLGRRWTLLLSGILELVCGIWTSLSMNYTSYVIARTCMSVGNAARINVANVLVIELTTAKYRSALSALLFIGYSFFLRGLMALYAYLIPNWRWLNVAVSFPVLVLLALFFYLPESPRWLISRNRYTEAVLVLKRGAVINNRCRGRQVEHLFDTLLEDAEMLEQEIIEETEQKTTCPGWKILLHPFSTRELAKTSALGICIQFGIIISVYGLLFYTIKVRFNVYLVGFINAVTAIPAAILCILFYRYYSSRKQPLLILSALTVIIMLTTALYAILVRPVTDLVLIVCSNVALILADATVCMSSVFISELYPSEVRAQAAGLLQGLGRIGSIVCTFINESDGYLQHGFPLLVYALAYIVVCISVIFLRDTTGENLPDVVVE